MGFRNYTDEDTKWNGMGFRTLGHYITLELEQLPRRIAKHHDREKAAQTNVFQSSKP